MAILITGLRYPRLHDSNSKEKKQVGKKGLLTGNAYSGFKFIPDDAQKFESYNIIHFNYKEV